MKARSVSALLATMLLTVAPSRADDVEQVAVRATTLSGGGVPETYELLLDGTEESQAVTVTGTGFTQEFKVPRMETWAFGHWEAGESGERTFRELGRVSPPQGRSLWLVFNPHEPDDELSDEGLDDDEAAQEPVAEDMEAVDPEPPASSPVDIQAIAVDEGLLGDRGVVVLNLGEDPVEVEIEGEKQGVEPGTCEKLQPKAAASGRFGLKVSVIRNGRPRPFVTTTWFIGEGRRRLAAVVQKEGSALPRLMTIDEVTNEAP